MGLSLPDLAGVCRVQAALTTSWKNLEPAQERCVQLALASQGLFSGQGPSTPDPGLNAKPPDLACRPSPAQGPKRKVRASLCLATLPDLCRARNKRSLSTGPQQRVLALHQERHHALTTADLPQGEEALPALLWLAGLLGEGQAWLTENPSPSKVEKS